MSTTMNDIAERIDLTRARVRKAMCDEGWTFEDGDEEQNCAALDEIIDAATKELRSQLAAVTAERDEAVSRLRGCEAVRDAAIRAYDQLGEALERIVCGDGTSLERLRRLESERDAYRAALADVMAVGIRTAVPEAIWQRARDLLKNGPDALTAPATKEGGHGE